MSEIPYYLILSASQSPEQEGKGLHMKALSRGNPPEQGDFVLFPGAHPVRLKGVRRQEGEKSLTLELRGVPHSRIGSDSVLLPRGAAAGEGRRALFLWKNKLPGGGSVSCRMRDVPGLGVVHAGDLKGNEKLFTLITRHPFLQIPGRLYSFSRGERMGEALLLMAEPWSPEEQKKMQSRLKKIGNFPGEEAVYSMNLRVRGAVRLPDSLEKSSFDGAVRCGGWALMSRIHDKALSVLEKRIRAEEGAAEEDLPEILNLPAPLCSELCRLLKEEGKLLRREGRLYNLSDNPAGFLSPMSRSWLAELEAAGFEGISLKDVILDEARLRALTHRGLIRVFDGFAVEEHCFRRRAEELLEALPRDEEFALPDIKGIQGLSRSRLLLLLEALEADGALSREGETRRVISADDSRDESREEGSAAL